MVVSLTYRITVIFELTVVSLPSDYHALGIISDFLFISHNNRTTHSIVTGPFEQRKTPS